MNFWLAASATLLTCTLAVPVAAGTTGPEDLSQLSIEELAQIQVTSASKREEPLSAAPTALYVLTAEEIESSGLTALPEVLRLAPNLDVQQVNASEYAISARGINGLQAGNKLLALIDGRSIYTPLASSIYWNLHQPLIEDIQQIEVISGPGGTLFGPNAVNGVINVTTKSAQDTIGGLFRGTYGGYQKSAAARAGFALGGDGAARVYANWVSRDELPRGFGADVDDDYRGWQVGIRSDFATESDHITLQGDLLHTDIDSGEGDGANAHNLLARWSHTLSPNASFQLQGYYDRFKREFTLVEDSVTTFDGEAQLNWTDGRHALVAGGGIRTTRDRFINDLNIFQLNPTSRRLWIYNAFVQDRFALSPELAVIAGAKLERSTFTGWQLLPNLRLAWQPNGRTLVWGAVSRAIRAPSRIDRQLEAPPLLVQATDFVSEKLVAVEAGYRGQPASWLSLSISGFLNFYEDIRTTETTDGGLPIQLRNGVRGRTYGVEAWGTVQATPWWRLSFGAATLEKDLRVRDGRVDLQPRNSLGIDPSWQLRASSDFNLSRRLQLTLNGRAVGELDVEPEVGSYVELGGRLAYELTDQVELFLAGRNLLRRDHPENNDPGASQLARRSVYAGTRLRF